jgi:hypothetical protein
MTRRSAAALWLALCESGKCERLAAKMLKHFSAPAYISIMPFIGRSSLDLGRRHLAALFPAESRFETVSRR